MASHRPKRLLRRVRRAFRYLRRGFLALVLFLILTFVYLNRVGVPGVIKNPILERLRSHGVDLQMRRLSLHWDGLVAEEVRFGTTNETTVQLAARRVNVGLSFTALSHLQLQVDALELRDGSLLWTLAETNVLSRTLAVTNIQTRVRFLPDDQWRLDDLQAQFAGAHIEVLASVANASAVREWSVFRTKVPARPGSLQNTLRAIADTFENIHFSEPPKLTLSLQGDALHPKNFSGLLILDAPGAATPWGHFSDVHFYTRVVAPFRNEPSRARLRLDAAIAQTQWATAHDFRLNVELASANLTNVVDGNCTIVASRIETPWAQAETAKFTSDWTHSMTNAIPLSGVGSLRLGEVHSSAWGDVHSIQFNAKLAPPDTNSFAAVDDSWGGWAGISDYFFDFDGRLEGLKSPKMEAEEIIYSGQWRPPELTIDHLIAQLYEGEFHGHVGLDVASRQLEFGTELHFDFQKLAPLLTEIARRWIQQFTWQHTPAVTLDGSLIMPAWTNSKPDWRGEVRPTIRLNGQAHGEDGTFRGVQVSSADTHFTYSNMTWRLPDLHVTRPEGELDLMLVDNDDTHDYYWKIHSTIDPSGLRPVFETNQQRVFDMVSFEEPPIVDGEIWGRWHDLDRSGAQLHLAATNFTFRDERVGTLVTDVTYTNHLFNLITPQATRGEQYGRADLVSINLDTRKIFITNGVGFVDPQVAVHMLGPKIEQTMQPYHFFEPPHAFVNGIISMRNDHEQDLTFDVEGGPFQWSKFKLPQITGRVHWWGDTLTLDVNHASFYDGSAAGEALFYFTPTNGADFKFTFNVKDANLHELLLDLNPRTNRLEGTFSGTLNVTNANTADWSSWQGFGHAQLRDGLLWEIPVFGIFSPILDGVAPGLGSSRVREGVTDFSITNSVISTENMELRSTYMRLQYRGAVDFKGVLDARVEAELLRDTWVVGRVVSLVLWPVTKLFEYRVTGILSDPKMETLYVPSGIFHPFRSLQELMPYTPPVGSTNAPPSPPAVLPSSLPAG